MSRERIQAIIKLLPTCSFSEFEAAKKKKKISDDVLCQFSGAHGETVLYYLAANNKDPSILEYFIQKYRDAVDSNAGGDFSPLRTAVRHKNILAIKILLECGVETLYKGKDGRTLDILDYWLLFGSMFDPKYREFELLVEKSKGLRQGFTPTKSSITTIAEADGDANNETTCLLRPRGPS